jgi:hypothetical protein
MFKKNFSRAATLAAFAFLALTSGVVLTGCDDDNNKYGGCCNQWGGFFPHEPIEVPSTIIEGEDGTDGESDPPEVV